MSYRRVSYSKRCLQASALAIAAALAATAAMAQDAPAAAPADDVVVVKGFRGSLKSALGIKKRSAGTVDSILGEDIGKFPDANLAESMQRIPGVVLSRGDGGEGRNISVRGLAAQFTRVRVNGMEASSQIGAADIYGAANNGRSFDFNAFPTEIFSALTARKTASADVEEGSLGATVDLRAPKPFDFREDYVLSVTARGTYNEISDSVDPKVSIVAGKKFRDSNFGILGTFSYSDRNMREVGYSAVDILSADVNGFNAYRRDAAGNRIFTLDANNNPVYQREIQPFCTPIGWTNPAGETTRSPDWTESAAKGASATHCSTNNPRTGSIAAYNTIYNLRRADRATTPGSGAFFPRIPRYVNSEQDAQRMGGSLTLQWKNDTTDISLDFLLSRFEVERRDNYIAGLSFARSITNNGQPMVSVKEVQFDDKGSLVYGLFDGVDIRSEGLVDRFTTTHKQVNLSFTHRFSDQFEVMGYFGRSSSRRDDPMRLQTFLDIIDADNFSIDFRDGETTPVINFGVDVGNPNSFTYAPALSDGTVLGGFSMQGKPQWNNTDNTTVNLDARWSPNPELAVKFGVQLREADFTQRNLVPIPASLQVKPLPSGVTLASITTTIDGLDDLWGRGAPSSWVAIDSAKWRDTFNFEDFKYCGVECGAGSSQIKETTNSAYVMAEFNTDRLPIPIRGDVGVRYYATDQVAVGHIPVAAPAGYMYQQVGKRNEVRRSYNDWMPSANVVLEFSPNLLGRVSAAKVMSRPELGNMIPSSGITATTRTGNINNPFLEPIRANTFDAGLEWYFRPGSLISVGYFYKDIETYIQRVTTKIPFRELGLPVSLLDGTNTSPDEDFTVGRFENTEGGPLKGIEVNLQAELDFLPGFWSDFGVLANYTHIESEIEYFLSIVDGKPVTTTDDLIGLSRDSASGTLYYENDKFSIRTTANYRGKYIRAIPASAGSDLQGNDETLFVDLSASYDLSERLKVIFEAQNLTDEQNRLFIDSQREDTLFELRNGKTFTVGVNYKF